MGKEQKVVIITGASQGIGADLVKGYRDRNYRVVANSRSIKPSTRSRCPDRCGRHLRSRHRAADRFGGARAFRPHRLAGQQCRHLHRQAVHRLHRGRLRVGRRDQPRKLLPPHQARRGRDAEAGLGPHRADHDQPGRSRQQQRSLGAGVADQGRIERRHQIAGDRIRKAGHPRQRGVARRHQDADACARDARVPGQAASGRPHGRSQGHRRCGPVPGKRAPSSPARSCTSMAARAPATDDRTSRPRPHSKDNEHAHRHHPGHPRRHRSRCRRRSPQRKRPP